MNDRHFPAENKTPRRRRMLPRQPNLPMLPRRRRKLCQPNSTLPIILPNELIVEIISWLPVKTLMKFSCVNKFFKTTLSDAHFVQMHLNKSSQNPHVARLQKPILSYRDDSFVILSIPGLLQKKITILHDTPLDQVNYHLEWNDCLFGGNVVGSCNGLICFIGFSSSYHTDWLCFWNPAIRTMSETFRSFTNGSHYYRLKHSFGYDNSTGTYKVVGFYVERGCNKKSVVKVFTLGDNSWRDIQCFPVLPLCWSDRGKNNGVYFRGTINWLALRNYSWSDYESDGFKGVPGEQYGIVSLDLSSESYTQMLLPRGFVEVPPPHVHPTIVVLTDCLCFGHDFKRNYFVIWQMKDFGVQESWVELFKISYQTLNSMNHVKFQPLYVSKNGHKLIFAMYKRGPTFVYNCIDNKIEKIGTTKPSLLWWVTNYIESLVPIR